MPQRPLPSDEKRARILEAAYAVCRDRGADGARMEEVAARARVSKGTLYRYFESKEQLLLATLLDAYERFLPLFREAEQGASLGALLDGMTRVLAELAPRMSVQYQAWGIVAGSPELEQQLFGFLRRFHLERGVALRRAVRDGQRRGVFGPDADAEVFESGVQALLSGFLYRASFHPESATPELLRRAFDSLVRGSLQPARAPEGAVDHG